MDYGRIAGIFSISPHRETTHGISANRALFSYRQVKPVDTVLVRSALELFTSMIVFAIIWPVWACSALTCYRQSRWLHLAQSSVMASGYRLGSGCIGCHRVAAGGGPPDHTGHDPALFCVRHHVRSRFCTAAIPELAPP